jgi:16S rRNA (adenine1518-N6/adenine1519-N6)-dimethyltransferase
MSPRVAENSMTVSGGHQTISYLAGRFAAAGIRPTARHGQNFLIDLNLQRLIVERAMLESRDVVLEVGTGTGALTALIAPRVAAVVTVEIDPQLYQLASDELFGVPNVAMLQQDALRNKSNLDERLIAAVSQQLAGGPDRRLKLVANLPFSVATPVIANLLASPILPYSMTVTVQKELAERIAARPLTKDYGALSVWIQSQCRVELVRTLPPSVFWPRPQVSSAIIHIEVDPRLRGRISDLAFFHDFTRSLFFHRRKFLRGVLYSALKSRLDKPAVDQLLAQAEVDPERRAEQLDVATILRLSEVVRKAMSAAPAT